MTENWSCRTGFGGSCPCRISTSAKWFMRHMKSPLWPYVNQALLWVSMAESWDYPAILSEGLPYQILRVCPGTNNVSQTDKRAGILHIRCSILLCNERLISTETGARDYTH
jgi:hypothetical protein